MITNPHAITVLCYGDSNTHGERAEEQDLGRWPADVRWTGQVQNLLGDGYYVIEAGLGGRTTDVDYVDRPGLNGRTHLLPTLYSHNPLDLVVLMLGTNDVKNLFGRTAAQIAAAVGGLLDDIAEYGADRDGRPPRVLVLSPAPCDERVLEDGDRPYDAGSVAVSRELAAEFGKVAAARGAAFADAGTVARVGADGIHLTRGSHDTLAALVGTWITENLAL
ncbi:GDSL-type esterase/lipase family protein [Longispora sp. NPDC051575]|uniref:GDSL-type esterase/lipase family protein n=1 Tax=Longispora sp. NPDC051575 TaxID=3154943 RepID=UPI00342945DE